MKTTQSTDLLTTFEAAELAGVKPDTIKAWKRQRLLPDTGRKGAHGVALYARSDVLEAMRQKGIPLPVQKQDELPAESAEGCTRCQRLADMEQGLAALEAERVSQQERYEKTLKEIARLALNAG